MFVLDPYDNPNRVLDFEAYKRALSRQLEEISRTSSEPTLKYVFLKGNKHFLCKDEKKELVDTGLEVMVEEVGRFCYVEEELFSPIKKSNRDLTDTQIDTKILHTLYPNLQFDAYRIHPIGMGLNIDGSTRISGELYKIINESN